MIWVVWKIYARDNGGLAEKLDLPLIWLIFLLSNWVRLQLF